MDDESTAATTSNPEPAPEPAGLQLGPIGLTPAVKQDPTAAAFFDIDNTVMRGASGYFFARGLAHHDIVSTSDLLRFAWMQAKFTIAGNEDMDDFKKITESGLAIIRGQHVDEIGEIANEVFDEYMVDKLWPGTLALAQSHLDRGQRVWLVSATPVEVAQVVAERLGLTGALGTQAQVIDDHYTGHLMGLPMHGKAKAEAIADLATAEGLDLARCSAYSDSANDIPMLSIVGNPVAVNPDHALRAHARTAGWQIRDYRSRRFALKIGVPMAATAGLAVGMIIGAAITHRPNPPVTPNPS